MKVALTLQVSDQARIAVGRIANEPQFNGNPTPASNQQLREYIESIIELHLKSLSDNEINENKDYWINVEIEKEQKRRLSELKERRKKEMIMPLFKEKNEEG